LHISLVIVRQIDLDSASIPHAWHAHQTPGLWRRTVGESCTLSASRSKGSTSAGSATVPPALLRCAQTPAAAPQLAIRCAQGSDRSNGSRALPSASTRLPYTRPVGWAKTQKGATEGHFRSEQLVDLLQLRAQSSGGLLLGLEHPLELGELGLGIVGAGRSRRRLLLLLGR